MRTAQHGRSVLTAARSLLVISPHPDDETLACSGPLIEAEDRGMPAVVVCLTDGEAHEAAYALAACASGRQPLGPGLWGAAVRVMVGHAGRPGTAVVTALWGRAAAGARVAIDGRGELEWGAVNARRWAALPCRVSELRPTVVIDAKTARYRLAAGHLCGAGDRERLGRIRRRECVSALRRLHRAASLIHFGLPDGLPQRWGEQNNGNSVVQTLVEIGGRLKSPVAVLCPHPLDADGDHRAAAALAEQAASRLDASVARYLVHHPTDADWSVGLPARGFPAARWETPVDPVRKLSALSRFASQIRADRWERFLTVTGHECLWES